MSSYFFGGFSANLMLPSGRQSNHSGCSLIHGWSGEAFKAMSSAISSPCSRAAATSRSKSSSVPSSGCTARCPPSCGPDRVRAAGVARLRLQAVVAPLAVRGADRVDRREVEHVEPEVAHVRQLRDHVVEGAVAVDVARLRARHHLVPGAERRRLAVGEDRERLIAREVGARPRPVHRGDGVVGAEHREAVGLGAERLVPLQSLLQRRRVRLATSRPSPPSAASISRRPSSSSSPMSTPAATFLAVSRRQAA